MARTLHADPPRAVRYTRGTESHPSIDSLRECNRKIRAALATEALAHLASRGSERV